MQLDDSKRCSFEEFLFSARGTGHIYIGYDNGRRLHFFRHSGYNADFDRQMKRLNGPLLSTYVADGVATYTGTTWLFRSDNGLDFYWRLKDGTDL